MRTRFLTDFFNSSTASQSLQNLDFLRFPPPELPSPIIFNFDNLSCFDQVASLNISDDVERFSVNESLSKLFSDVLPQYINVEIDQQIARAVNDREKIDGHLDDASNTISTLLEFETPELQSSLKDFCVLHEEKMHLLFEFEDAEVNMDLLDFSHEVHKLVDIQKSIFHVEDYHPEFQEDHRSDIIDNGSLIQGQISSNFRTFPLLEIDETSMGIDSYIPEDKHIIFESIEPQQWIQKDELSFDDNEHFLSKKFNILEHLLNHPPIPCHQIEVLCVNSDPEYIITAIDYFTLSPLVFEPPKFLNTNTSHFSQVFSDTQPINETEDCEEMFSDTTSTTFNDLIVKHELILRDDSFKSLPVPIFPDHENILSVQLIVEEIFLKLKLQPSSTSDDIYLDWHLLEEDTSSPNICMKMLEDVDTYCVDADMKSCDSEILILEFVLFDGCSNEEKCKEKTEVLHLMDCVGTCSSKLNGICKKMEIGEALVDNKVIRDHHLAESMPQFDDLDFFLNSFEGNLVNKQKAADKKLEMDHPIPVVSAKRPIDTHETSKKKQHTVKCFGGDFHSASILKESSTNSHSKPIEEKNSIAIESLEANVDTEIPELPESKKVNTNTLSLPDAVIIVNTQNVDTEMIISRRSTYRKILALEKQGVQVVERDLNPNLPVDVILTPAVCLVLYDIKNITSKTSSSDTQSSSCVENIAANVLTSLSFAFTGCFLIFEGEVSFLGGIMESSDELYAAAASVGIDLQIFYSYSCDTTNDIIVNCILHSAKSTKGLYPKMPESETLAESFLSKFPSVNPLSAHAILSSVGSLLEFFEMPHQQRVCLLKKYLVPQVSLVLFTALCRYGEKEDSRSGMTDCSSSVSSGHDSRNSCPKVDHESNKRNYMDDDVTWDTPKFDLDFDDINYDFKGQHQQEGCKGQVIDIINDDDMAGVDFSFGPTVCLPENYGTRKKLSYDWCNFPTAAEITLNSQTDSLATPTPVEMSSEECSIVDSPFNLHRLDMKEKLGERSNGGTPLSKAISSSHPLKGSPWTMDFLNRMKEKSRMRQQSLPLISSAPCFGNSPRNYRKRKSPSILDLYRYKKNNKGQNSHLQPQSNSSKAVKPAAPKISSSWVPIDKRAKRKLTFATEGSKGQTKLIWE
ncbi:hypothetical protein LXL04_035267 [Taraxacum kok-saghyz]